MKYDVAIIGGGAAGMMAAIVASGNGKRVVLIERNPQLGRKLLATGNGRCNLTNRYVTIDRFHGNNLQFIESILSRFDQNQTLEFFQDLGLVVKEEDNGRIFPVTNQASSVAAVLRHRLDRNNVDILLDSLVVGIEKSSVWSVTLNSGEVIEADSLIIATGGKAAHYLGSTGDGWMWAKKLGHTITPFHAALVPVETVEQWPVELQGIKVEARVWSTSGDDTITESCGDVLFTSYGVSGPGIMAQAGAIAPVLNSEKVLLHIDMFPEMSRDQLDGTLARLLQIECSLSLRDALIGLLPGGMIPVMIGLVDLDVSMQSNTVSEEERLQIVAVLKDMILTVSKLRPFKEAQVTAGGICSEEIDHHTLESKLVKGLYFAGEMLDADGDSGGFNLQWAWSSGYVAGNSSVIL